MPIYEFYCEECHTIFNFFSRSVNTSKRPLCPKCKRKKLKRQMSTFAPITGARQDGGLDDLPVDEARLENAMNMLAMEADRVNEEDPRQAASLVRKLSDATGLKLGPSMEEALRRMETGEDPEHVEEEMGDLIEEEVPLMFGEKQIRRVKRSLPLRDETLYEL
ncbi:MAG: zinc ribbon domain-containing protein [Deltaproteobacteria bacterium]|nr:zinc ribbon domain-containing protein [Deltaproteobacteria bacterium]RLC12334.1 MAG: zinc ribbon domain-containing protein [Deltaproteobacteria bacterium]